MWRIVTDGVAWSVGTDGRSVMIVSHAKTIEPVEMPFGLWLPTRVGLMNHVLDAAHIGETWRIGLTHS